METFKISRRTILNAILLGAGIELIGRGPARANTPVRITYSTKGSTGAIWRPMVEQEGTPGLDLTWVSASPGEGQVQLAAGAVDVAFYGAIGATQIIQHGTDVVIFGPAENNHGRWIVRGDSPYHSPHDLVGKRIATQAETSETYLQARMAAATVGIDLKRDCQIVFGPPTINLALFQRGDVDGVIVLEPTATRLVAKGARQIATVGEMWQQGTGDTSPLFLVGLAAKRFWVDQNKAAAHEIVAAFQEMYEDLRKHPGKLAGMADDLGIPQSETNALSMLEARTLNVYSTDWGPSVFANIDRQIEYAVKTTILPAAPPHKIYEIV